MKRTEYGRGTAAVVAVCAALALAAPPGAAGDPVTTFGDSGPGQLVDPTGIAIGSGGAVYVSDRRADRVVEFSSSGAFVRTWGTTGTKNGSTPAPDGAFSMPVDLATGLNGDVYVSDEVNNRIQRFDANGTFLGKWGANGGTGDPGTATGAFSGLLGIGTDPTGNVYTSEGGNHRVQKFTSTGVFLDTWGSAGQGDGQFFGPNDVAADAAGNSYVADGMDGRLDKFDPAGTFLAHWYYFTNLVRTFVDQNGDVYLIDVPSGGIHKYKPDGTLIGTLSDYGGSGCINSLATSGDFMFVAEDKSGSCSREVGRVVKLDLQQPDASLTGPSLGMTRDKLTFDASGSSVPFSQPTKYEWDLDGNGSFETNTGSSPHASRAYAEPHVVTVRVRVSSAAGKTDTASTKVEILRKPPPGPVGVSIERGARFTNSARVDLRLVWPVNTRTATISNDGGFGDARTVLVRNPTSWKLDTRGPDRLQRTVYVRFGGSTQTFADDIFLDRTRPRVRSAMLTPTGRRSGGKSEYVLEVRAHDNLSGVTRMQVTRDRSRPGKLRPFRRRSTVRLADPRVFVRVRDAAGNLSRWHEASTVVVVRGPR